MGVNYDLSYWGIDPFNWELQPWATFAPTGRDDAPVPGLIEESRGAIEFDLSPVLPPNWTGVGSAILQMNVSRMSDENPSGMVLTVLASGYTGDGLIGTSTDRQEGTGLPPADWAPAAAVTLPSFQILGAGQTVELNVTEFINTLVVNQVR